MLMDQDKSNVESLDQDQDKHHREKYIVNLSTLPIELLVYIISILSSVRDIVKLRYVSRWLRCVIEGTPSLWKEFVWPYYDSREEYSLKEVLKVCGQHIRVLSFPYTRVRSTLVKMLQHCSNVQRLSLQSIKLDPEQLTKIIDHMRCLQTLELKVDDDNDIEQLLLNTSQLHELTIDLTSNSCSYYLFRKIFKHWKELQFTPSRLNIIWSFDDSIGTLIDYVCQLTAIPSGTTANFRLYKRTSKVRSNFSPTLPYFQVQVEGSGQVTIPCVKLSDYGVLRLNDDVAVMTDCQYGGRTMCMVKYPTNNYIVEKIMKLRHIARFCNLGCVTHFDISNCHSGHLEQLAITCPNLQRLNLQRVNFDRRNFSLKSLQGLQAIASHCHNLQGLNLLDICVSQVEDQVRLWEILSNMKLTYLGVTYCVLRSEATNKEKLIYLYQKCWTIRGIQCVCCYDCDCVVNSKELPYFPSLNYCYIGHLCQINTVSPTIVQDVINNCTELKVFSLCYCTSNLSLNLAHNNNLQQLYIHDSDTDVPDDFMTSVSAHSGLVHVVMKVKTLEVDGITSLVRNSPQLITLHLCAAGTMGDVGMDVSLKKKFWNRKLFTAGHCKMCYGCNCLSILEPQGTDLFPLWMT